MEIINLGTIILNKTPEEAFVAIVSFAKHSVEQDGKKLKKHYN